MSNQELINYLVRKANKLGRDGIKVIQWVPSETASQDWRGHLITMIWPTPASASSDDQ